MAEIVNFPGNSGSLRVGGTDGYDGGMPPEALAARLDALEKRMDADLREMKADIKSLIGSVNEVSGKVSQLPSTWTIAAWFVGVAIGLVGLAFTIAKAMK